MVLLGDFCNVISSCANDAGGRDYAVSFNREHLIYKAHFPGEPITPGACILQIAYELLQRETGKNLSLSVVRNIKFLKIISPASNATVCFSLQKILFSDDTVSAQVIVGDKDDVFSKLSVVCRITD